jgi:hypothetical protein
VTEGSRHIVKSAGRASIDVSEALANLLVAEILDHGSEFYVVSAWISDVPVVDNSAGTFSMLDSEWEERWLYLSEVLVTLMKRGALVRVKTNDDPHNRAFLERLASRSGAAGAKERCQTRSDPDAHSKGIVGKTFALRGSMNLTYRGLREREETVEIDVDTEGVATLRLEFSAEWRAGVAA